MSCLLLCTFFTLCLPTRHDCVPHTTTPGQHPHTTTPGQHPHTTTPAQHPHTSIPTQHPHPHTCTTPSHQHTYTTPSHHHTCTTPSHHHISLALPHPLVLQFTLASSVGSDVTYQCLVNSRHLMHNPFMSEHMHMHPTTLHCRMTLC